WCFKKPKTKFVTMTRYQENLPTSVICPPEQIKNSLAEILSNHKLKQFRVAESEKYAHVTYFFNGGREQAFPYEDRLIISSPRVDSFDKTPEMKADEIAHAIVDRIKKYDLIVANISNVDMVGHTGNITAVADAIKATDAAVEKIAASVLDANGGMILTADHGNAEQMVHLESEGDPETIHTLNPVPFIYVTNKDKKTNQTLVSELNSRGILKDIMMTKFTLADIAPTILDILGIKLPKEMTGQSLVKYLK
ncbi:MAG: alkaline phosphatase family protein, partial [Candidatus Berkelbacteria bacterium]|nr:alkaline phosphatase family protein [Candidatus Berkelbacteria bacterium]